MNVNSNRYIHLRKIWQLVVVVLLATQSSPLFAEDSAGRFSQGLIWKVEKEGAAPSYLLGTMHVADSRVTNFSSTLNQIIKRCRSLTLEVKLDANAQLEMSQAMIVKDGKVLNQQDFQDVVHNCC
ncbi:MAG: TraB/GumN family protein [Pseudomonadales bacterium]|nr:TraB/GumN family protein [Pseudomonadales bacterium]